MKRFACFSITVSLGLGGLSLVGSVHAGMFDMMNPGEWFGGDNDRYYDRYDRYGYGGGPYGYGGGPYGWGRGPYGYGGGPYGYGGGPYGWGGGPYGGYGPGSTIVVTPQAGSKQSAPALPE